MPGVNFTSIQEALDQSDPGETVYVLSGKYNENLNISKQGVTLKGVDTGEGAPVISAAGNKSTITVAASKCTVDGFVVMNSGNSEALPEQGYSSSPESQEAGITVLSDGNHISNTAITGCKGHGLVLSQSNGNTIQGDTISDNGLHGISLRDSSDNILSSNSVTENGMNGLYLQDSDNNIIRGSLFLNNKQEGIMLINSNDNLVADNVYDSIREENSKNNIISGNKVLNEVDISGNVDINTDGNEEEKKIEPEPVPVPFIRVGPGESIKSIQTALDLISPGGVIEVLSGTYSETLLINKAGITLRGMDSGGGLPLVSGNGVANTITIMSSGIAIQGLVVTGSGNPHAGIEIKVSGSVVRECRIANNRGYGVSISSSDGSIIAQNTIEGNVLGGIILTNCTGNMIFLNNFNNAANARDSDLGNQWNSREAISYSYYSRNFSIPLGNYWSDYEGSDDDGNGVGDKNYSLPGGAASKDMNPLIKPWPFVPEPPLSISGVKFKDSNGNGAKDPDEPGLANWTIQLAGPGDLSNTTYTDEEGDYSFAGLGPGRYIVSEKIKQGYSQTYPSQSGVHNETLIDSSVSGVDFGNCRNDLFISGCKFMDYNADGNRDEGEPGLKNWTIALSGAENRIASTDSDGMYNFTNLRPGSYSVKETNQTGFIQTCPLSGVYEVILSSTSMEGVNFGNRKIIWTVCEDGSGNFAKIQEAVDDLIAGDIIEVHSGTYKELVDVNKQLTLQGIDTGSGLPIVDAGGFGSAITISADGCTVEGFEAKNSGNAWPCAGIHVISKGNIISGNTATGNNWDGISLNNSNGNMISDNTLTNNDASGIYLESSNNNTIEKNTATGNGHNGIKLWMCNNISILGNIANKNKAWGIYLVQSSDNTVRDNAANGNNRTGIFAEDNSAGNTISGNDATGNSDSGIRLDSSNSNSIYLNNFDLGWSNGANTWNSPTKIAYGNGTTYVGNRWSGYSGRDCDGDGIGDTPYSIPGGSEHDNYPLTNNSGQRILTVCASGCNYTTIQAAINAACPGDIIEVRSGNYFENVVVNKTLTLRGIDTGSGKPVVDAGGSGSAISISANGCTVEGFVANNSISEAAGITVTSNNNTISGNTATGNTWGIYLYSSSTGNTVSDNTATGNGDGIRLDISSTGNTISGNTATGNDYGIDIYSSSNNDITGNTATGNTLSGIYLDYNSNGNTLSGNTATGNTEGILLISSSSNTVSGNTATDNSKSGILLESSSGNTISGNTATDNSEDIRLDSSNSNSIYLNNFDLGWSNGANTWNSPTKIAYGNGTTYVGNRWSGYSGKDCNGDGIGDTPYNITGGTERDYYPIIGGQLGRNLCISGYKLDTCSNPLAGWNITLTNSSYAVTEETGSDGYYKFCGLMPGEYNLTEEMKDGWTPFSAPGGVSLACSNLTNQNFTNEPPFSCISGYILDACTGKGAPTGGINIDGPLKNFYVHVENGSYWICGPLCAGNYTLTQNVEAGWFEISAPGPINKTSENVTNQNFTNQKLLCISGYKLNDRTKEGISGWTITLSNSTYSASTTTNDTGYYQFCGLLPGNYSVTEETRESWISKSPVTIGAHLTCSSNLTNQNFTNSRSNWTVCKDGSCDFTTIQAAINVSDDGDILEVAAGTYEEHVVVDHSLSIIGAGSDTLVDGTGNGTVFVIGAGIDVTLKDMNITNGKAENGGGIFSAGELALNDVTLFGNNAGSDGGGVYCTGNLTLNGGDISGNIAGHNGGGIFNSGALVIERGSITSNHAVRGGGISSAKTLIINGGEVLWNNASEMGGGIYISSGSMNLGGGEISGNIADNGGGGFFNYGISIMMGGEIYENDAEIYGGGVSNSGTLTLSGGEIYSNKAIILGGGVNNYGILNITHGKIYNNNAEMGGGINNDNGILTSSGGEIYDNEAEIDGGGISNYGTLTLSGCKISGNKVTENGGGIYIGNGSLNLHDCILSDNSGYQIYIYGSSGHLIYRNNISGAPPLNQSLCYSQTKGSWNSTEIGNNWSNYKGNDSNNDSIGDEPYSIDGGSDKDYLPMMSGAKSGGAAIQISLDGSLQTTPPASQAQYLLKVTNLGDSEIRDINITDHLSSGIAGISVESGAEPDITLEPNGTHILRWQDPGPLGPRESREIGLLALLDDPLPETLISRASVRAVSADGRNLSDEASLELNGRANISIEKEADPSFAQAQDLVSFNINVSNTGEMNLKSVRVDDTLPQGMSYVSDDSNGSLSGRLVSWDLGPMMPGNSMPIILTAKVNEAASGVQTNTAEVTATTENNSSVFASSSATVDILSLNVSKEADRKTVKRGENITYTITVCNDGSLPLEDVVAWDVIDKQLILLYSSMDTGEDGKWHLGTLAPGQCAVITMIVQVPESNFRFDMTSSVSGVGYVNVADDYSTTLPQLVIKNTAYASSSSIKWQSEDTAMVTVLGEAGTELSNREHGSGTYESEEELRIITENKSIQANRSMTAKHQPVTLSLYGSRTLNTSSLWNDRIQARNRVTGLTMTGSVSHAKNISLDSRIKLDENESVVDLYSEFEGQGQFGTREKSQDGKKTLLDSQDDYAGSFKVYQKIDEYGSGLSSTRSASGTGFVAGDRRIGKSQRSHEAGTGDYSAEEAIETYTNFIHKDINLSAASVDLSRASPRWPNQSLKWMEGIYSRDPGRTLLGEEYSSLEEMDKETLVAGLNYMQSQANFTGKASYSQAIEGQTELEQEYLGKYSIRYKASLQGTAKFDRPHINVIKEGEIIRPEKQSKTYARYKITVENDGNEMLSPIYVNDLFPPGAVYVNSSLRPSLAESSANWSLTHLPVGGRSEITLWLEIGENLSNRLVNRVQAAGSHAAGWASASNISVLECGWLPCAPTQGDQIVVTKRAFVNESDSDLVWYLLRIENHGNCTPSLTVTDSLPRGMKFMEATPDVTSYDRSSNTLFWNIISLRPNGAVSIIYQVQVTDGGKQVNQVKVEAISPEGCDINPAYDSTVLILGQKNAETWPDDWKPPADWVDQCFETSCI